MKRVLIVTFFWPPNMATGVWRPLKLAQHLPAFGWRPTVVTTSDFSINAAERDESKDVSDITTYRVGRCEDKVLHAVSNSDLCNWGLGLLNKDRQWLENSIRWRLTKLISFPDIGMPYNRWILSLANKVIELARSRKYHAVFVTSPPHSMTLAGGLIARRTHLPVILDFRDPWTQNFECRYGKIWQKLADYLEAKCLRSSRSIIVVSPLQKDMLHEKYPHLIGKVECITNGFDPGDIPTGEFTNPDEKFVVSLLGSSYDSARPLFEAIQNCVQENTEFSEKFLFRWIGRADNLQHSVNELCLEKNVELLGHMPHAEALDRCAGSQALWLESPFSADKTDYVIRGKTFEYMAMKLPILGSAPANACIRRIVEEACWCDLIDSRKVEDLQALLSRSFKRWQKGELTADTDEEYVAQFSRVNIAGQMANLLDRISSKSDAIFL